VDTLLLTTPSRHANAGSSVELSPKRLQHWIASLPTMDVQETVSQLEQALVAFNSTPLSDVERLRLLEIYFAAYEDILSGYDEVRLNMLPIAAEKRRAIAQAIMQLYLDLAAGYKIIIKDQFERRQRLRRNPLLLTCVYRAIELINLTMLYAFRAHRDIPPLCYLELYQLYSYAEENGVLESPVKNLPGYQSAPQIGSLFKQIMLLVLTDPYHINPIELYEYYVLAERFANTCEILPLDGKTLNSPFQLIDLASDKPPVFSKNPTAIKHTPFLRRINISSAIKEMKLWSDGQNRGDASLAEEQKKRLTSSLVMRLSNNLRRREPRRKAHQDIHLITGMRNILYACEKTELLKKVIARETHAGIEVHDIEDERLESSTHPCRVLNESNSGRRVSNLPATIAEDMMIGNVVALLDATPSGITIMAGLVRWKKEDQHGQFHFGIEIIPGQPTPTAIQTEASEQAIGGLVFPPVAVLKLERRILLPHKHYCSGAKLNYKSVTGIVSITLGENIMNSPAYVVATIVSG